MLGNAYLAHGQMDKALAEFSSLSAKYPDDPSVQKTYTQLLILSNRLEEATALNESILKKATQDAEALVLKGEIQFTPEQSGRRSRHTPGSREECSRECSRPLSVGIGIRGKRRRPASGN